MNWVVSNLSRSTYLGNLINFDSDFVGFTPNFLPYSFANLGKNLFASSIFFMLWILNSVINLSWSVFQNLSIRPLACEELAAIRFIFSSSNILKNCVLGCVLPF